MNIFYLDENPTLAAIYHHDVHLRKMITETAQMLSTSIWKLDCDFAETAYANNRLYLPTHINHPCSKWCRESSANWLWTLDLFIGLCVEYTHRTGKIHATQTKCSASFLQWNPLHEFSTDEFTSPALAMPDEYKTGNAVESYREFYKKEKQFNKAGKFMGTYTNSEVPKWVK